MCIRDSSKSFATQFNDFGANGLRRNGFKVGVRTKQYGLLTCLLYTSDAADERSSVDLGGRRIIKKKKKGLNGNDIHIIIISVIQRKHKEIDKNTHIKK